MAADQWGAQPVVIGLFPYASDARRALHVLHEHHFTSDQIAAAFREAGNSCREAGPVTHMETVRIPLSEERIHIDKDTVLREEYKVGKREITQNETVTDTVRRERLLIDDASRGATD